MAYFKLFLISLSIFIFTLSYLLLFIFVCPFSAPRRRCQAFISKILSKVILLIFGVRVICKGSFPAKPFLLISNHLSYLDVLVYFSLVDCTFLAKLDVAGWPLLGKVTFLFGTIYIDRRKKRDLLRVIPMIVRRLEAGDKICFFPEGTSSDGKQIKSFYSALFECAVRSQRPVVVSSLAYYAAAQHRGLSVHDVVCWQGDNMSFLGHGIELAKISQVIAYVNIAPEEELPGKSDKESFQRASKVLSQRCRQKMLEIFSPSQNVENFNLMKKRLEEEIDSHHSAIVALESKKEQF